VALLAGGLGYREAMRYEHRKGERLWGMPAAAWSLIWALSLFAGALLWTIALRRQEEQEDTGSFVVLRVIVLTLLGLPAFVFGGFFAVAGPNRLAAFAYFCIGGVFLAFAALGIRSRWLR
jgi:hypothetical protein